MKKFSQIGKKQGRPTYRTQAVFRAKQHIKNRTRMRHISKKTNT